MSSEVLANKRRARAPDVPNAHDPHSENTSRADEYLRLLEQDVQEDYCGEKESEVDNALEAGGREGEGATRRQESRMRKNSQEDLGPQEIAQDSMISEAGGEVSAPKRTSRGSGSQT